MHSHAERGNENLLMFQGQKKAQTNLVCAFTYVKFSGFN